MQHRKTIRLWSLLATIVLLVALVAGCAQPAAPVAPAPAPDTAATPAPEEPAAPEAEMPADGERFTIGVSNGFVGSEWRTQMIQRLQEVNAELMAEGLTNELIIESADVDIQGQIQQIQNLINRGVDAIIINPNSQTGLNSIIEEAIDEGIVVIAVDQEVSAQGAINVVIDQKEWAMISAEWLAEQLNGEGDVVLIEGFVGHPANEARMEGVDEVFANYPGINVVARDTGMWDQATGQQVMSDFLASIPNIDGVWTQDGMAEGALRAVQAADLAEWLVMGGEARAGYIQLANEVKQENPDFETIGVVNPPGVGASGLRIAVLLLQGRTLAQDLEGPFGNSLYVPIPGVVTDENFDETYAEVEDQPASYTLDGMLTAEEAEGFFE
jgi:ribose transport system substrate-binding protein